MNKRFLAVYVGLPTTGPRRFAHFLPSSAHSVTPRARPEPSSARRDTDDNHWVDQHSHRRIRVIIDLERRTPTEAERAEWAEAIAATPNAVNEPFESVWLSKVEITEPDNRLGTHGAFGTDDEMLGRTIAELRRWVSVEITRRLTRNQIPIDPRFAELIGTGNLPNRHQLAASTAALLELSQPSLSATEALLTDIVLLAHGWYYDPYAGTESTEVGHYIVSNAQNQLSAADFDAALRDLEVDDDVALWSVAAGLVKRMGIQVW